LILLKVPDKEGKNVQNIFFDILPAGGNKEFLRKKKLMRFCHCELKVPAID
jgi:hypothetical protein